MVYEALYQILGMYKYMVKQTVERGERRRIMAHLKVLKRTFRFH